MTARALATKLKRLERLAKMRLHWDDTADSSQRVVLPPVEEFRVLPLGEQKRLLSAWRPPPSEEELPPMEEFEKLPVQERIRQMEEAMWPPDPHASACFDCLPLSEPVNMCRGNMVGSRPLRGKQVATCS
jgi:hypothetical protein